ncbi:voltage-gated potassium channel protein [Orrella marina]|nr:voltage-gated potassium channel protein [Orrella marina]
MLVAGGSLIHVLRKVDAQAHRLLAVAVLFSGVMFIWPLVSSVLEGDHLEWFAQDSWRDVLNAVGLAQLPRVVISLSLVLMSFGLLSRARVAWVFTLVMLTPAIWVSVYQHDGHLTASSIYNGLLGLALLHYWSAFGRSSVAAATLFALSSLVSLFWYAILGVLYLGHEFAPKVLSLPDAVYFAVVAMTTVGFGDIVPVSEASRMFVVSVILLGVTVFASALGAVLVPVVSGKIRSMIQRKARLSMKKNHTILCGATPLALALYKSLIARAEPVTVIIKPGLHNEYPASTDLIEGDAASDEVLEQAGVKQASNVLAMQDEDAENAFIVLAVKAIDGSQARTIAVVNNSQNLEKIRRVKPDLVFSPQLLSAELLSRILRGEKFDADLISELFVAKPIPATVDQDQDETMETSRASKGG